MLIERLSSRVSSRILPDAVTLQSDAVAFALSTALLQLPLLAVVKDRLEDAQNEGDKK